MKGFFLVLALLLAPASSWANGAVQIMAHRTTSFSLPAVQVTPIDSIISTQLGTTDSCVGLLAIQTQYNIGVSGNGNGENWTAYNRDTMNNGGSGATYTSENVPGFDAAPDGNLGYGTQRLNFNDSTGGTNHSVLAVKATATTGLSGNFHQQTFAWDLCTASRKVAWYIDGVPQTLTNVTDQGTVAANFKPNIMNNVRGFGFGLNAGNGGPSAVNISQFLLDTHTAGLLDGSSHLSAGVIAAVGTGNAPMDFGANGSNVLGTQPDSYHVGDAAHFLTELGTSAATWSMTSQASGVTPVLRNAPYGPGGIPAIKPYPRWPALANVWSNSNTGTMTGINAGFPIVQGDLMLCKATTADVSANINRAITAPAGWTSLFGGNVAFYSSTYPFNVLFFYKIMGAGDVTAAGGVWTGPAVTYTSAGGNFRASIITCMAYGNASSIDASSTYSTFASTGTVNVVAPSVTIPTNGLLDNTFVIYDGAARITYPTGQSLLYQKTGATGSVPTTTVEYPAAGASGTRTAVQSIAQPAMAFSVAISP